MTNLDRLYTKVAEKHGLPKKEVQKIFKAQFNLVYKTIGLIKDIPIRLPYIGVFRVRPGRRKFLDSLTINKDEQQQD